MSERVDRAGLSVAAELATFIEAEALPGTGIEADVFWNGFSRLVEKLSPTNADLLAHRQDLQDKIDAWHVANKGGAYDRAAYTEFLSDIGYFRPEGPAFKIETKGTDPEFASVAGPQLVVPITNARYALNAANARWGSLYDAYYGTDALGSSPEGGGYDEFRGSAVVAGARAFLDETFPLEAGSHAKATTYTVKGGRLLVDGAGLAGPSAFVGYTGDTSAPDTIMLVNNGLHVELVFDRASAIGSSDTAGMSDVRLEAAMSAIMDCEDSVACVDASDKVVAYRNWLGLMRGDLVESFQKGGQTVDRALNADIALTGPAGEPVSLKGRALMLIRNVGHLMTNPAILTRDGAEIYEGMMDAMITTLIAMHDLKKSDGARNSVAGSVYVVKPKMHGPDEVAFADEIFSEVERVLSLPQYTVKLGIMDEERRTSVNLKECIRAAKNRVAFINTGFLDRTGDEIHTSMDAGAFSPKDEIKGKGWIAAYEDLNVDIGLECGFSGVAQIGKGMWAMPDMMEAMIEAKIGHPSAGANCAWVPSPTAATLHALHYHKVDVFKVQAGLKAGGRRAKVADILEIPLADGTNWSQDQIKREVENNAQGILGYVVRWIDQGVGCSKVPDINNIGLMEDRATCRISAQHISNWLHHGVISEDDVRDVFARMASVVDGQNAGDPTYAPMAPALDGIAYRAALELVLEGRSQPSGYTEPILHARRLEKKAALA